LSPEWCAISCRAKTAKRAPYKDRLKVNRYQICHRKSLLHIDYNWLVLVIFQNIITGGESVPNLKETIGSIVQKLRNYRALYERNEMAVREHVVNPILRALDWDPENPAEVVPNIYTEEGFPDYCLTIANNRKLFIEVKNLNHYKPIRKICF
jgi:hypothetical protein